MQIQQQVTSREPIWHFPRVTTRSRENSRQSHVPSYYRARYYDPAAGRLISEDPIGFSGGLNFYSYAQNSPLNYLDPSGLHSVFYDGENIRVFDNLADKFLVVEHFQDDQGLVQPTNQSHGKVHFLEVITISILQSGVPGTPFVIF